MSLQSQSGLSKVARWNVLSYSVAAALHKLSINFSVGCASRRVTGSTSATSRSGPSALLDVRRRCAYRTNWMSMENAQRKRRISGNLNDDRIQMERDPWRLLLARSSAEWRWRDNDVHINGITVDQSVINSWQSSLETSLYSMLQLY